MGLFAFLKTKKKKAEVNVNVLLLEQLKESIEKKGHSVDFSTQYAAIIVDEKIEIATAIMPGNFHSSLLAALIITINKDYFPNGIEASLVGIGNTPQQQVKSAADNYLNHMFPSIIQSFINSTVEELDFTTNTNGKEVVWHPKPGDNIFQGKWSNPNEQPGLYSLIKEIVPDQLKNNKLNWLNLYVSRQPTGEISGECLINNEFWEEGYALLEDYAKTWKDEGEFLGQKQFIMFRRCDSCD